MSGRKAGVLAWWGLTLGVWLGVQAQVPVAWAHESRPAYLQITETAPGRYDVLWRTPLLAGMRLPVRLVLPKVCHRC